MDDRALLRQALEALEVATTPLAKDRQEVLRAQAALRERLAREEQEMYDWSVFNTGAEVAGGLSYAEAMEYMTPSRLERGWSAVRVIDKYNIPGASPSATHSADSAGTFCNEQPRPWQGLAKLEFQNAVDGLEDLEDCWIAIESALREKNA